MWTRCSITSRRATASPRSDALAKAASLNGRQDHSAFPVNENRSMSPRGWSALPKVFGMAFKIWIPLTIIGALFWGALFFLAFGQAMSSFGPNSSGHPLTQESAPPDLTLSFWLLPITLPQLVISAFHLPKSALPYVWAAYLFFWCFIIALFRHRRIVFR